MSMFYHVLLLMSDLTELFDSIPSVARAGGASPAAVVGIGAGAGRGDESLVS